MLRTTDLHPGAEVLPYLDAGVDERVVIPSASDADVRVVRTGLPCQRAPIVQVTREEHTPVVAVERGPPDLGPGRVV